MNPSADNNNPQLENTAQHTLVSFLQRTPHADRRIANESPRFISFALEARRLTADLGLRV